MVDHDHIDDPSLLKYASSSYTCRIVHARKHRIHSSEKPFYRTLPRKCFRCMPYSWGRVEQERWPVSYCGALHLIEKKNASHNALTVDLELYLPP